MAFAIRLLGLFGLSTPHDGRFVVEYDPYWLDHPADDWLRVRRLVTTDDQSKAKLFNDFAEAWEYYRQVSPNISTRGDGNPNRPLTAYYVEFVETPSGAPSDGGSQ